jgi:transposase InsO family protein
VVAEYQQRAYGVTELCAVLEVARSGYYAWRQGEPSPREQEAAALLAAIEQSFAASGQTYGSPRVLMDLRDDGWRVSRKRVARLMRQAGLVGRRPRRRRSLTDSAHGLPVAPNLLNREFSADEPNQKWVGDITYIPTAEGWLYLAVVLDLYSRKVVGWAMSSQVDADLAVASLHMALTHRRPPAELLYHSDRGSQYASFTCQTLLTSRHVRISMSRKGNVYDNAVAESFYSTLKTELVHRRTFQTRTEAAHALFNFITVFYNRQRRHSTLGYLSPQAFERGRQPPR